MNITHTTFSVLPILKAGWPLSGVWEGRHGTGKKNGKITGMIWVSGVFFPLEQIEVSVGLFGQRK